MDKIISNLTDKKNRLICATIATLLSLFIIFIVLILNHLSGQLTKMRNHVDKIEKKTVDLEKGQIESQAHLTQLDRKFTVFTNSPTMKAVEALAPRVILLEKQMESIHVRQKVTTVRLKPVQKKQYYEVREGDTLYRISRKFALSVDELRKMNDLDEEDTLLTPGEMLLVSR